MSTTNMRTSEPIVRLLSPTIGEHLNERILIVYCRPEPYATFPEMRDRSTPIDLPRQSPNKSKRKVESFNVEIHYLTRAD